MHRHGKQGVMEHRASCREGGGDAKRDGRKERVGGGEVRGETVVWSFLRGDELLE